MGQVLHGCARTTEAVRRAIQQSQASLNALADQYGINPKTVAKWRRRQFAHDAPMGPKESRSTVLTLEEEAAIVAFRKFTLLPLDDCLYAPRRHKSTSSIDQIEGVVAGSMVNRRSLGGPPGSPRSFRGESSRRSVVFPRAIYRALHSRLPCCGRLDVYPIRLFLLDFLADLLGMIFRPYNQSHTPFD